MLARSMAASNAAALAACVHIGLAAAVAGQEAAAS